MNFKADFILSVDWEGNSLESENLLAMEAFSKSFPQIPVLHFLNAAYYTNLESLGDAEITRRIRSVLGENCELGLHIHPWESLVKAAGVEFRIEPSYISGGESAPMSGFVGGDVPLTAYNKDELEKLFSYSIKKLKENGFEDIKYFRGGGWVSSPEIFEIIKRHGIFNESSSVPADFVAKKYPNTPLVELAKKNWSEVNVHSKPYKMGEINQFPNNICLADYVDATEVLELFVKVVEKAKNNNSNSAYFHFGWHQETAVLSSKMQAVYYLSRVEKTIELITDYCEKTGIELVFPKLSETMS